MFKSVIKGLLAVAMFGMAYIHTPVYLDSQSFDTPRSYVEKIYTEGGSGSAVVIAPGLVLTAAHVAENSNLLINGKPTKTLKISKKVDLALVQAQVDCPCVKLGESPILGDAVVAVGWSLGKIEYATPGTVQGWGDGMLWTDTTIAPGNSGGGVFAFQKGEWKLVGITVQVAGMGWGFLGGLPVMHMVRSVTTHQIEDFLKKALLSDLE